MMNTIKTTLAGLTMSLMLGVTLMLFAPALPAIAQHQHQHGQAAQTDTTRGMMQGGMMQNGMMQNGMMQMMHQRMQQMMSNPLQRAALLVHLLPTLQEPLALTDAQVAELKQHAQAFQAKRQELMQQMKAAQEQLQKVISEGEAAPDQVQARLEAIARHHARLQALAYETALQMKKVLTDEQRSKLAAISPMQWHRYMMENITMMQMMQMMHGGMMHGGMMQGGMMQGGMMQGGMMQGGMMQGGMMQGGKHPKNQRP
ncbi:hypothetical protein GQ464_012855 [Rhodocaloribacter litoris]|uniref:Spy/CpxP family protein refolding chaperone n=1 Tax=Rhodocaloribacter litoris TaxID=2558931 RepID=UPI001E453E34|nr:hypothetical protein [Rhodocaloribacter litoris]QXD14324.1 hypothetical protein GQ464_012855 [Rhodocaloribacter litoris]